MLGHQTDAEATAPLTVVQIDRYTHRYWVEDDHGGPTTKEAFPC